MRNFTVKKNLTTPVSFDIQSQETYPISFLFRQVFSDMDFLGWYSTGEKPGASELYVHKQIMQINESPLFLQMSPGMIERGCLSVSPSVIVTVCLSVRQCVCLSISCSSVDHKLKSCISMNLLFSYKCRQVGLKVLSVCTLEFLSVRWCLSIRTSVSVCPSISVSVHPSACLSVSVTVRPSIVDHKISPLFLQLSPVTIFVLFVNHSFYFLVRTE